MYHTMCVSRERKMCISYPSVSNPVIYLFISCSLGVSAKASIYCPSLITREKVSCCLKLTLPCW